MTGRSLAAWASQTETALRSSEAYGPKPKSSSRPAGAAAVEVTAALEGKWAGEGMPLTLRTCCATSRSPRYDDYDNTRGRRGMRAILSYYPRWVIMLGGVPPSCNCSSCDAFLTDALPLPLGHLTVLLRPLYHPVRILTLVSVAPK